MSETKLLDPNRPAIGRGLPTAEERQAEANVMMAALAAKPAMASRPKFDLGAARDALAAALVKRDAALAAFSTQVEVLNRAEAATAAAARACDEYAALEGEVGQHYANLIGAGKPLELTPDLKERTRNKRAATEHRDAVQSAQLRIHVATEPFREALAVAENVVAGAALLVVRCQGEALAEKCAELRMEFIAARTELEDIASVRLNGALVECGPLWLSELRDPVPEPAPTPAGVAAWNKHARQLCGRA